MSLLDSRLTPSAIVRHLDQYVGQDEAHPRGCGVRALQEDRASQADGLEITKSNVLLVGPTGTGKTLVCESLARLLKVPFVTADATSLAQSRYVNDEIEAILERLHDKAEGDVSRTQQGIVFIDEIDKLLGSRRSARPVGRKRAARAAEDHGGCAGPAAQRPVPRHDQRAIHLRRRLRRARRNHVAQPRLWFRRHFER
jgi:ATP-dependent Clp protease ATP-binding subunit ClpX